VPFSNPPGWDRLKSESLRRLQVSERAVLDGFNRGRLTASLAVGLLVVGFLLVAQWKGVEGAASDMGMQSDGDLAIIIQELTIANDDLRAESRRLEIQVQEVELSEQGQRQLLNEAVRELQGLRVAVGLESATGPGVKVSLADPERVLLAQDYTILVNELRAAGAEAVAIDGTRVSLRDGFVGDTSGVLLGDRRLSRNSIIVAIGDPSALGQALDMPGGVVSQLTAFPGVKVTVSTSEGLEVPGGSRTGFEYAESIES